jgi:ATP-binding cassette subfamily A (ABC1) protein 3
MSKGQLKCCGSPLFLKSKYGSGYTLTLTKNLQKDEEFSTENFSSTNIINLVKSYIPDCKVYSDINSEISFILPRERSNAFSELFSVLEKQKAKLEILNIGISITTVEDVFLKYFFFSYIFLLLFKILTD